jgi:hypothetical protein
VRAESGGAPRGRKREQRSEVMGNGERVRAGRIARSAHVGSSASI